MTAEFTRLHRIALAVAERVQKARESERATAETVTPSCPSDRQDERT